MLIQTSERMMWSIKRIFKSVYSNFHIMKSLTIYSIQKAATAGGGSLRRRRSDPCPALLYGILPPAGCRTRSRIIEKLLLLPAHDPAAIAIINRYCFPQRTEAVYLFCPYPGNRSKKCGLRAGADSKCPAPETPHPKEALRWSLPRLRRPGWRRRWHVPWRLPALTVQ